MPTYHQHENKCWRNYEPCGEHHAHSYNCGGGELSTECPQYEKMTQTPFGECQHGTLFAQRKGFWRTEFDISLRDSDGDVEVLATVRNLHEAQLYVSGFKAGTKRDPTGSTEQHSPSNRLVVLYSNVQTIMRGDFSWEEKYTRVFQEYQNSGVDLNWYDPDTSYQEDVEHFVAALERKVEEQKTDAGE